MSGVDTFADLALALHVVLGKAHSGKIERTVAALADISIPIANRSRCYGRKLLSLANFCGRYSSIT